MKQCAVIGCVNSEYRIKKWKQTLCQKHQVLHGSLSCNCPPPFRFFCFPTALKDPAGRLRWRTKIDRGDPDNPDELWDPPPAFKAVICSEHFIDGEPTQTNPDPELKLDKEPFRPHPRRFRRGYKNMPGTSATSTSKSPTMVISEEVSKVPTWNNVPDDMIEELEPGEILRHKPSGKEALNNWLKEAKQRRRKLGQDDGPPAKVQGLTHKYFYKDSTQLTKSPAGKPVNPVKSDQRRHTALLDVPLVNSPHNAGSVDMTYVTNHQAFHIGANIPVVNSVESTPPTGVAHVGYSQPALRSSYVPMMNNVWTVPESASSQTRDWTSQPAIHHLYSQADEAVMQFLTQGKIPEEVLSKTINSKPQTVKEEPETEACQKGANKQEASPGAESEKCNETIQNGASNMLDHKTESKETLVNAEVRTTRTATFQDLAATNKIKEEMNGDDSDSGEVTQVMVHVETIVKDQIHENNVSQDSTCDSNSSVEVNREWTDESPAEVSIDMLDESQDEKSSLNLENENEQCEAMNDSEKDPDICVNGEKEINLNGGVHFQCLLCEKKLNSNTELKAHVSDHSDKFPAKCPGCSLTFDLYQKLQTHVAQHANIQPFFCSYCDVGFRKVSIAKTHVMTHTGVKPFHCTYCGRSFRHSSTLTIHVRGHTGQKPYVCRHCGKAFADGKHLRRHVRVHTGERPYSCPTCGLKFSKSSTLKSHSRTHSGEKPYSCSFCGRNFAQSSTLKGHVRQHTGEKPYSCPHCTSTFTHSSAMKSHVRLHTRETPYRCSTCCRKFTWLSAYKRHVKGLDRDKGCKPRDQHVSNVQTPDGADDSGTNTDTKN